MADRKALTYKMTFEKEMSSLTKAFRKLSPTKRQYSELSKSSSTSSVSSGSSFASNSYAAITPEQRPVPGSSRTGNSSGQNDKSRQKEKEAKEKELLQKLQKSVNETTKTLDKYVAVRKSKK